jgi:hypothetical protein
MVDRKRLFPSALLPLLPLAFITLSCGGDDSGSTLAVLTSTPTQRAATPTANATLTPAPTSIEPSPTPPPSFPLSEADAVWREIWTYALLVEPVLRPTYLPAPLSRVQRTAGDERNLYNRFGVTYSDLEGDTWLTLAIDSGGVSAPAHYIEQLPIRNTLASYTVWDTADATGRSEICWREPGSLGRAPPQPYVPYCITTHGLSKVDLVQVVTGLRPLQSVMAVPPRWPYRSVEESDVFWEQVAEAATSLDPILRPVYLPPAITRVWVPDLGIGGLRVVNSNDSGDIIVVVAAGALNPALPGPNGAQERVQVKGSPGYYQVQDKAEPLGSAYVCWQEPGRLGDPSVPGDTHWDHVTYLVSSVGLSKEELLAVANGLVPIER